MPGIWGSPRRDRPANFAESMPIKSGVFLCISWVEKAWVICVKQTLNGDLATGTIIEALCDRHGFKIIKYQKNPNISTDNLVDDYVKLYNLITNCDELADADGVGWKKMDKPDLLYSDIAKMGKIIADSGNTRLLSRVFFDVTDPLITVNRRSEKRNYREHLVPCDFLLRHMIEMYKGQSSVEEVEVMLRDYLKIAYIDPKEANRLDYDLGLKTTMPLEWEFGDLIRHPVTARLDYAKIDY